MTPDDTFVAIKSWLSQPSSYAHRPERVEIVETHISCVFLAGNEVFKLKKRLRYDFVDFTTLAARREACAAELTLNRRLAETVYVDVLAIVPSTTGDFSFVSSKDINQDTSVCDYVVQMRRLPLERTMDRLLERAELRGEHIDALARKMLRFYESSPPASVTASDYLSRVEHHVRDNRATLHRVGAWLPSQRIDRVHGRQLEDLWLRRETFEERVRAGLIVDGHGDLRPEHICFNESLDIFDCLEFNAEFRLLDQLDEIAFLAAECDFLHASWAGERLLTDFRGAGGNVGPDWLFPFYKSYRACVRAKVAALRASQLQGEARERAEEEASQHMRFAAAYLAPRAALLVAIGGLSGTGKSTLAHALGERLGCEVLRTDDLRRDVVGTREDRYSPEARDEVYRALEQLAADKVRDGMSVIVDGTFARGEHLTSMDLQARKFGSRFLAVQCECRPEVARERIRERLTKGVDVSEATEEVYAQQVAAWQPWPASLPSVRIATDVAMEHQLEQVRLALQPSGASYCDV